VIARQKLEHVAGAVSPRLGARLLRRRLDRAAAYRRSLDGVVFIGVTGSSGKTTTKELIAAVLSTRLPGTKSTASSMQAIAPGRVITFGASAGATLRTADVSSRWPDRLAFTVHYDGRSFPVATRLNGRQWTSAVLAALGVGTVLDVPIEAGIEAVESFEPVPGRMSVVDDDGVTFIRDDWKAPLWTFDHVFEFVHEARAARKVLVIGTVSSFYDSTSRRTPGWPSAR
jgi:UDP-N-acetylmuramyl pentapeptide synthase